MIFLIVRRVLASASEGFDRYVLSLSIYPVSRSLIKDTSQLGSGLHHHHHHHHHFSRKLIPCRQFYPTLAFLSMSLTHPSNTDQTMERKDRCFWIALKRTTKRNFTRKQVIAFDFRKRLHDWKLRVFVVLWSNNILWILNINRKLFCICKKICKNLERFNFDRRFTENRVALSQGNHYVVAEIMPL